MNLKEALKADFGIEVKIAGSSGGREDPFVIEACAAAEAVRSQLDLLRGLGRGRRELWRLLAVDNGAGGSADLQSSRLKPSCSRVKRSSQRGAGFISTLARSMVSPLLRVPLSCGLTPEHPFPLRLS